MYRANWLFIFSVLGSLPQSAMADKLPNQFHGLWVPDQTNCSTELVSAPAAAIEIDTYVIYRKEDRCTVFRSVNLGNRFKASTVCHKQYLAGPDASARAIEKYIFASERSNRMRVEHNDGKRIRYKRCTQAWAPDKRQVENARRLFGFNYDFTSFFTAIDRPLGGTETTREFSLIRSLRVDSDGTLHHRLFGSGTLPRQHKMRIGEVVDLPDLGRAVWWMTRDQLIFQTEHATYFRKITLPLEPDSKSDGLKLGCKLRIVDERKPGHFKSFRFTKDGSLVENLKLSWKGMTCTTNTKRRLKPVVKNK